MRYVDLYIHTSSGACMSRITQWNNVQFQPGTATYTTLILVAPRRQTDTAHAKVIAMCVFNKLQTAGLFLALDSTSTRTDPSTS